MNRKTKIGIVTAFGYLLVDRLAALAIMHRDSRTIENQQLVIDDMHTTIGELREENNSLKPL